jgi:hypothetical protein
MFYTLIMSARTLPQFKSLILLFLGIFLFSLSAPTFSLAQFSLGVSTYYPIQGDVNDGDIIVIKDGTYEKAMSKYQPGIVGVYIEKPSLEFKPENTEGMKPVLSTGESYVNVSTTNGAIRRNDFLTSSDIPGVAMLSTAKGYVVGNALEDYNESDPTKIGKIRVSIFVQDTNSSALTLGGKEGINILDIFSASKLALYESPSDSFKYIVAATVVVISFIFGFITFRKVAVKGVEAIGRNPLASKVIGVGILLNLIITVSIIIAGLVLAYFIVTL